MMYRGTRAVSRLAGPLPTTAAAANRPVPIHALYGARWRSRVQLHAIDWLRPVALQRHYATKPPTLPNKIDKAAEKAAAEKPLEKHPDQVSVESSVRHAFSESTDAYAPQKTNDGRQDLGSGIASDLAKVKETISLTTVPPLPLQLGLAGTLPYLGTSIATMYLSWDLNTTWPTDSSLLNSVMVSHDTARQLLGHLEPLQLGYGAVIISFLGAIHWGLEFAEKKVDYDSSLQGRERARFRYGLGVAASVVAWPSVLMPVEWALITQFLAFTGLYFADSRATTRGWTPPWYSTYRFVLTFVVGSAILLSLVGRARIGEGEHVLTKHNVKEGMYKLAKNEKLPNWEKLEQEEREKKKKEKEEKEEEERRKKKEEEEKKKAKEKEKKEGKKDGKGGKGGKDGDKSEEKKDDDDSGEGGSDGDGKGSDSGEGDTEKKD